MHSEKAHAGDAEGVDPLNQPRSSYAGLFLGKARVIHFSYFFWRWNAPVKERVV